MEPAEKIEKKPEEGIYLGIDFNETYTMISFYLPSMDEPGTVSTVVGSEDYQIPTFLAKRKGLGQWYFGRDAKAKVAADVAYPVDNLYAAALENKRIPLDGEMYEARELLAIFVKKLLTIPGHYFANAKIRKMTIVLESVTLPAIDLFSYVAESLSLAREQLYITDRRESFYYFALSQEPAIYAHDVVLYDYRDNELRRVRLTRNERATPQIVTLDEKKHGALFDNKDTQFLNIAEKDFTGIMISSVYLIGDGFDGDWMKSSLAFLCKNRRVFLGKNMYSKGACYAGVVKEGFSEWNYIFIGDNELKCNLSLKVSDGNEMRFETLCAAGENWFDAKGECEAILDGSADVTFYLQRPESREAAMKVLELTDLPARENRTTRLRITARPISDRQITIEIRDLGFGELVPTSGKVWTHTIGIKNAEKE